METTLTILYLLLPALEVITQNISPEDKRKLETYLHYQKEESEARDKEYNPKHGYEPYWVDGHWVFQTPTVKEGETTTPMPQVCGDECSYLYQPIREVCGRDIADTSISGCLYLGFLKRCDNAEMDDHMAYGYKTFNTYCEFLDVKCKDAEKDKHWMFVHVGACKDQDTVIKEIREPSKLHSRLNQYLPQIEQTANERNLTAFA
ncbi:uncharacterized protein LOC121726517 isoform X2 [Aricia agestis]|uniref:uncharacterized protein LOC121726517 isoform X2 n=1 Tax=Aricia agestis TaxID=91739 RepID=UPI001C206967|nr:uncharacterized protein LOC121726517 isoform X2 [Aricia agestis]